MKKEFDYFVQVFENFKRLFFVIFGGVKVFDKIQFIDNFFEKVNIFIVCGGMVFIFKKIFYNVFIGNFFFDEVGFKIVGDLMEKVKKNNVKVVFFVDYIIVDKFDKDVNIGKVIDFEGIFDGWMGFDCGEEFVKFYKQVIDEVQIIFWNGFVGVFEFDKFVNGIKVIFDVVVDVVQNGKVVIIGGGDIVIVVVKYGVEDKFSYVLIGGGVSLEFFEGKELFGVMVLSECKQIMGCVGKLWSFCSFQCCKYLNCNIQIE